MISELDESMFAKAEKCTGCLACYNACPKGAISIKQDEKGFYIPVIDPNLCIKCGICRRACPEIRRQEPAITGQRIFAAWCREEKIVAESSSGGVFSGLAGEVLANDGIVFGAAFDGTYKVIHKGIETRDELAQIKKSKYVQSFIGTSYKNVEKVLKKRRQVLFSGTPCQISGLKNYLDCDYDDLLTVDLVCHGVPSPAIFFSYLQHIKKNFKVNPITEIDFRNKTDSWQYYCMQIKYSDGRLYKKDLKNDPYLVYFLNNYCLRESCYSCRYASMKREGDISLGDFWGYKSKKRKLRNTDKGISLVIINTKRGDQWFDRIKENFVVIEESVEEATAKNTSLLAPSKKNVQSDEFWSTFFKNKDFSECIKHFPIKKHFGLKAKIRNLYYDRYYLVPGFAKKFINSCFLD